MRNTHWERVRTLQKLRSGERRNCEDCTRLCPWCEVKASIVEIEEVLERLERHRNWRRHMKRVIAGIGEKESGNE
jgi:hypothetical protein